MNKVESNSSPLEFESPVEFILVGVEGIKRAIVAKSKGAKLDLAAYAQRQNNKDDRPYLLKSFLFPFPFPTSIELWPLSVDSYPTEFQNNSSYDGRASELTLVWRGSANYVGIKKVAKEFNIRTGEIVTALDNQSKSQLEWVLAPIIDECNKLTNYAKEKRLRFRYAFWLGLLIYVFLIAATIVNKFLLR